MEGGGLLLRGSHEDQGGGGEGPSTDAAPSSAGCRGPEDAAREEKATRAWAPGPSAGMIEWGGLLGARSPSLQARWTDGKPEGGSGAGRACWPTWCSPSLPQSGIRRGPVQGPRRGSPGEEGPVSARCDSAPTR